MPNRPLGLLGNVKAGEAGTALLLLLNLCLILVSYYVIKVVREPLILASGGAEQKSYASAYQALALIGFVPLYSWFSSRVGRLKLVMGVTLFFTINIELFVLGARLGVSYLGIVFYVWVGIFSLAVIAQFWSFANDIYSRKTGERLFPIVAIGSTLGAPLGSFIAKTLSSRQIDPYSILHISAGILTLTLALYWIIHRRLAQPVEHEPAENKENILKRGNGFRLVLRSPYLRLIALLMILLNLVNTTGEYILSSSVSEEVIDQIASEIGRERRWVHQACLHKDDALKIIPADATDSQAQRQAIENTANMCGARVGSFYGSFLTFVSIITALLQALLVSRIVKYLGIPGVLFALPVVAFGVYGLIGSGIGLAALRWAKTAENSIDYSVMNTAKAMLWLPTTREEKYNGKQAVDTFFVRTGDVLSALLVWAGVTVGLGLQGFAIINIGIIVVWLMIAKRILSHYRRLVANKESEEEAIKTSGVWQIADIKAALAESEQRVRASQMELKIPKELRERMKAAYQESISSKPQDSDDS